MDVVEGLSIEKHRRISDNDLLNLTPFKVVVAVVWVSNSSTE